VFVMWYWGLRSPFWALHGDTIFESGLTMEGSATSAVPTLYYRDSVSLAQDQNAQHARNIPPMVKDSLGVWLADNRWGNFMMKERWREAMVMDLARGNLLAPNLWGDIYLFNDADVEFLARVTALTKRLQPLMLHRRTILGDPWHNDVYGYAYGEGRRAAVFANNVHFASRMAKLRLDGSIGLGGDGGTKVDVVSHFPERRRFTRSDRGALAIGDALEVPLRPFESLMLEVMPAGQADASWPVRELSRAHAESLGMAVKLAPGPLEPRMQINFADGAGFESQGFKKKSYQFEGKLPALAGETPIFAAVIRLRQGTQEWRYKPPAVQIVQAMLRVDDRMVPMAPVPDGRQFGNTQGIEGCSWITYKVRLGKEFANKPMKLAVHAYLPDGVEAQTEGWIVQRWWEEDHRPMPNGYYTDEPS
jgi:hypothetical protein